jgi:hypothetical protein
MQAIFLGSAWIYLAGIRVLVEFGRRVERQRPGSGVGGRDRARASPIGKRLFSRSI